MSGPAAATIARFGAVEDDQRYTRLVELFADDASYYDPFFGPQRGKDTIHEFMTHMEEVVPGSGARFDSWESFGDVDCGFARWDMVAPNADGVEVAVPGQSLYRLRDGLVTRVVDYVDPRAYRELRGPDAPAPNFVDAAGALRDESASGGPALEVILRLWETMAAGRPTDFAPFIAEDAAHSDPEVGELRGRAAVVEHLAQAEEALAAPSVSVELVDAAGDEQVGWSQWTYHLPGGDVPGWSLHLLSDGLMTVNIDHLDTVAMAALMS